MRVVQIGYYYGLSNTGGAAIAATRLHLALLNAGIESHYVCYEKKEEGPNVHVLPSGAWRSLHIRLSNWLKRCAGRFFSILRKFNLTCGTGFSVWGGENLHIVPLFGLERLLRKLKPDVVHVQWVILESVSFRQLQRLGYPIVMNLHDFYMINAVASSPLGDERFLIGFDSKNSSAYERWMARRKRNICHHARVAYLAPSKWVRDLCVRSWIGRGAPAYAVSNIIDWRFVYRENQRLAGGKMVILFGALWGRKELVKGWPDLVRSLERLPEAKARCIEVRVFGNDDFETYCVGKGVAVRALGPIGSQPELCKIYNSADLFAIASLSETQGMTKCEALLCGLPVITFNRAACAEGVVHKVNGWVAPDGDVADYASGIEYFLALFDSGELEKMHEKIAQDAACVFAEDGIVSDITHVYEEQIHRIRGGIK